MAGVPPMTGAEYLTAPVLAGLWCETDRAFDAELAEAGVAVQDFLRLSNHLPRNGGLVIDAFLQHGR